MYKKFIVVLVVLCMSSLLLADPISEQLKVLSEPNALGYLQPLANSLGAGMNSGLFNTAKVLKPLTFNVKVSNAMVIVPTSEKTYWAESTDGILVKTGTILGDTQAYLEEFGVKYLLPKGQDLGLISVPQASVSLGLPFGNEIMVRALPEMNINNSMGDMWMWGVGLKHCISRYLPSVFPIDLSVQGIYQEMSLAEIIDFNSWAVSFLASKSILMLTVYGGVGYEKANLNVKYEYDLGIPGISPIPMDLKFQAQNEYRATIGTRATIFPFISVFADYSVASTKAKSLSNTINVGVGVGF